MGQLLCILYKSHILIIGDVTVKTLFVSMATIIGILFGNVSIGQELQPLAFFEKLPKNIMASEDVSAIAKIGSFLVIGSDEGVGKDKNENYIQLLKKGADESYEVHSNIFLFEGNKTDGKELDIEGIAVNGNTVYVVGSHSSKRKKVKEEKKYNKNQEKFKNYEIEDERNRDWLYRLTIDSQGKEVTKDKITLRGIIKNDTILKTFSNIPSKENGVDIEGLGVKDEWLYIGFRGPVFRDNYVPVMKLKFDDPEGTYNLLYIELGGRGIRDMTSVSDGFLILAGPVGDGPASYQLYHWDGRDALPGKDRSVADIGKIRLLGAIRPPKNGKAEGVVVIEEEDTLYNLIIVYDGVKNRDNVMQRFRLAKP